MTDLPRRANGKLDFYAIDRLLKSLPVQTSLRIAILRRIFEEGSGT